MLTEFLLQYPLDPPPDRPAPAPIPLTHGRRPGLLPGASFGDGIYRTLSPDDAAPARHMIATAFPHLNGAITPFASDWRGNVFATTDTTILLFELGDGEAYEAPHTLESFHRDELVHHPEETLGASLYAQWRAAHPRPLPSQCVGWIIPMFLGGTRTLSNLELTDQHVAWHLTAQMIQQTRNLPPGTPVRFRVDPPR